MTQQESNEKLISIIEKLSSIVNEQEKRIEKIEGLLASLQDPLVNTMETVQRHDEGINLIMNRMIELGFDN